MRWSAVVLVALGLALAGFIGWGPGDDDAVTAAQPSGTATSSATQARLRDFAYQQMKQQSEKTCRVVPRKALAQAFAGASGDPGLAGVQPARASDNYLALWYAEDVRIHPIRLQQAAYDGCLAGLAARR
jgi:hypothetical protein